MKYDLAKQDPEVSEQESTKWVDKSLRALTRPVHKSFSGFVLSLYYISYLHMISKTAKKVKPEMGKSNIIQPARSSGPRAKSARAVTVQ